MISLIDMEDDEKGIIAEISGGRGLTQKLENMGLFVGKEITKVSKQWRRGPIVVRSGNTQVALGYGIAMKIMVRINTQKEP
jgi:ferrous iron transport protein A